MIKRILTAVTLLPLSTAALFAGILTPGQALERFWNDSNARSRSGMGLERPQLMHTFNAADGEAAMYLFNCPDQDRMVILSADDVAYPMLGYLDDGDFDPLDIPANMKWWLEEYGRQIEYARSRTADPTSLAIAAARSRAQQEGRHSIAPLLKTRWDQGEPYNNRCPLAGTVRTWTGCVATSMAQVMKYFNYPEKGKGTISYTCESLQKKFQLNLALKKFDWDNMLDTYTAGNYNDTQAQAVAYLMQACGYSVKMEYGLDSSGALAMNVRKAMVKYFGYDANSRYVLRDMYSTTDWNRLMYENLENIGPVIYGGGSNLGGGHSFICDGYDSETGFFHFNWGWTGMSNGYFSLDALNPAILGSGGGAGGGYNFTQDALFGLRPSTGDDVIEQPVKLTMQGSLVASIEVDTDEINLDIDMQSDGMWVNYNPEPVGVKFYAKIVREDAADDAGAKFYELSDRSFKIDPGYGILPHSVDPETGIDYGMNPRVKLSLLRRDLDDGSYRLTVVTADSLSVSGPYLDILCPHGYYDYVRVRKTGDIITVTDIPAPSLDIISAQFTTTVNSISLCKFKVKVTNNSDIELSTGLAPLIAYQGKGVFLGESVFVTVYPGETVEREWTTPLYVLVNNYSGPATETKMDLLVFDERSYLFYDFSSSVMMQPAAMPDVSLENPKVTNAVRADNPSGLNAVPTYYINDPYDIKVSTRIKVNSGEFNHRFTSSLCLLDQTSGSYELLAVGSVDVFYKTSRLTKTIKTELSYPSMIPGEKYLIMSACDTPSGYVLLSGTERCYVCLESAGIENVTAGDGKLHVDYDRQCASLVVSSLAGVQQIDIYNVGGSLVKTLKGNDEGMVTVDLVDAPHGILIVKAADSLGNVRTTRIAR